MAKRTFQIYRYDPDKDAKPYMQTVEVELDGSERMLLDALMKLKAQDPTLSFRRSCREGVCGSDAMNINGKNGLACLTNMNTLPGTVVLKPLPGLPVIRDLIVDMTQFFKQYNSIKPYLVNDNVPPETERLARTVIAAFAVADAPPAPTGIRDVMSVAGNLTGESETQLFLETATGQPASLTVIRRPGMEPQWGVSWSEIVDQAARPPVPATIEWYRLACFLPPRLPRDAFLQDDRAAHARAEADYGYILAQLGGCPRIRT